MKRTDHEGAKGIRKMRKLVKVCLSSLRCVAALSRSNLELLRLLLRVLYCPIQPVRAVHTTAPLLLLLGHTRAGALKPSGVTCLPGRRQDVRCLMEDSSLVISTPNRTICALKVLSHFQQQRLIAALEFRTQQARNPVFS